jgi:hypothetical protein
MRIRSASWGGHRVPGALTRPESAIAIQIWHSIIFLKQPHIFFSLCRERPGVPAWLEIRFDNICN